MSVLTSKEWWGAALVRCIKTFCQAIVALLGTQLVMSDFSWQTILGAVVAAAVAAVLSLITSIAGLPEVNNDQDQEQDQELDDCG